MVGEKGSAHATSLFLDHGSIDDQSGVVFTAEQRERSDSFVAKCTTDVMPQVGNPTAQNYSK